jgi:multidrug efflux pump subunit AcrA (membrane-fusion protein)
MKSFLLNLSIFSAIFLPGLAYSEELPTVKALVVKASELYDSYAYPVLLEARQDSEIFSEIDGIVKEMKVKIGQRVRIGQTLLVLKQSKPDFSYAPFLVKSPFTGTIASVSKKIGSSVKVGEALIHLVNYDELSIKFEVPEAEMGVLKAGLTGELHFKKPEAPIPVVISGISPVLNPTSGTASGELTWDDKKADSTKLRKNFLPGMIGRASFKLNFHKGISIPKSALVYESKNYAVRIVADGKSIKRIVKIGKEHSDHIEILDGLKEGDQVITSRNKYLKEGEAVKIDDKKDEN